MIKFAEMKCCRSILAGLAIVMAGCSVEKNIAEKEYVLSKNTVSLESDIELPGAKLSTYLAQQSASFKLFGGEKVYLDTSLLGVSCANLADHLEYLGYFRSSVSSLVSMNRRKARVFFYVIPGKQYTISKVKLNLPSQSPEFCADFETLSSELMALEGTPLSESALSECSERVSSSLRNMGYYGISSGNFFFEADTLASDGNAILDVSIHNYTRDAAVREETPILKYNIGRVTISHDADMKFREEVLRDLNVVHPGDLYSDRLISSSYSRLSSIRAFSGVSVALSPDSEKRLVDCDVSLSKSKSQGFKADLESSVNSSGLFGISPQLTFFHKNIFHGGEQLNFNFMGNFQFKPNEEVRAEEYGVSATLKFPGILGIPKKALKGDVIPSTEFKLSYNSQDRPEYQRSIISSSFGFSGVSHGHFSYQLYPVQLNVVKLWSLTDSFYSSLASNPFMKYAYQDHFDAGVGGMLYWASNMDINPKVGYRYCRLDFDCSGNLISLFDRHIPMGESGERLIWGTPYTQYVRSELTIGGTARFGRDDRAALAGRLMAGMGYAYGNSSALPYEKQFYAGGANSMRGWQVRALGPGLSAMDETFIIPSQTGDCQLEANLELRFPLFWKFSGALFTDVGNVWMRSEIESWDYLLESMAADWGMGLRCDLGFLVFRVDVGFKLYDPSLSSDERWRLPSEWLGRDGFALHFGVGYPF